MDLKPFVWILRLFRRGAWPTSSLAEDPVNQSHLGLIDRSLSQSGGMLAVSLPLCTADHSVARFGGFLPNMSVSVLLTMISC